MFKLNIECSKDIQELHINFADGTSSELGVNNEQKGGSDNETEKTFDNVNSDEQKSDVRPISSKSVPKNPRKNLTEFLDTQEKEEEKDPNFKPLTPPKIQKRNREANVTEEAKNGKY